MDALQAGDLLRGVFFFQFSFVSFVQVCRNGDKLFRVLHNGQRQHHSTENMHQLSVELKL